MIAPRRIVIDTDPGQDDAVALLLALAVPELLEVLAITTVTGNVPVELTTANALRVRDLARRPDVPVFAGMATPLVVAPETAEFVCGEDGLAGSGLAPAQSAAETGHAVDAIIRIAREQPQGSLILCALGPLTNIAMALRLAPDIARRLGGIAIMGGAMNLGNMTPAAEFNFYHDPHAAAVVFGAGVPITLFGLHVTHQSVVDSTVLDRMSGLGTRTGACVHGMLTRPRPGGLGTAGHPMHDPCVIGWLLWPELFGGRNCHVEITCEGSLRGRSTIDWNGRLRLPSNAFVAGELQAEPFHDRLLAALARLP